MSCSLVLYYYSLVLIYLGIYVICFRLPFLPIEPPSASVRQSPTLSSCGRLQCSILRCYPPPPPPVAHSSQPRKKQGAGARKAKPLLARNAHWAVAVGVKGSLGSREQNPLDVALSKETPPHMPSPCLQSPAGSPKPKGNPWNKSYS